MSGYSNTNQLQTKQYANPQYLAFYDIWEQMRTTIIEGEGSQYQTSFSTQNYYYDCSTKGVKGEGEKYLPKTEGQKLDLENGHDRYNNYKSRAIYYNYPKETKQKSLGMLNRKKASFNLLNNDSLEEINNNLMVNGYSGQKTYEEICERVLIYGRDGALVDLETLEEAKDKSNIKPHVCLYNAFSILDWNDVIECKKRKLLFVLLNETKNVFNPITKERENKVLYRLLSLTPQGIYYNILLTPEEYKTWDFNNPNIESQHIPNYKGKVLDYIPFYFTNVSTNQPEIEYPPLFEQSNLSLAVYRSEADYRQLLYKQSFSMFVGTGLSDEEINQQFIVDGSFISTNDKAKAYYIGVNGEGISEQREALQNLKNEAKNAGIVILDKNGVESEKALQTRFQMQTSNLVTIAKTVSQTMKNIFLCIGEWMSIPNYEQIEIIPNLDFNASMLIPKEMLESWNLVLQGGMTKDDFYELMKKNEYTTIPTFEEWQEKLEIQGLL